MEQVIHGEAKLEPGSTRALVSVFLKFDKYQSYHNSRRKLCMSLGQTNIVENTGKKQQ